MWELLSNFRLISTTTSLQIDIFRLGGWMKAKSRIKINRFNHLMMEERNELETNFLCFQHNTTFFTELKLVYSDFSKTILSTHNTFTSRFEWNLPGIKLQWYYQDYIKRDFLHLSFRRQRTQESWVHFHLSHKKKIEEFRKDEGRKKRNKKKFLWNF